MEKRRKDYLSPWLTVLAVDGVEPLAQSVIGEDYDYPAPGANDPLAPGPWD